MVSRSTTCRACSVDQPFPPSWPKAALGLQGGVVTVVTVSLTDSRSYPTVQKVSEGKKPHPMAPTHEMDTQLGVHKGNRSAWSQQRWVSCLLFSTTQISIVNLKLFIRTQKPGSICICTIRDKSEENKTLR